MSMRMCEGLGVLTRDLGVRIINISSSGCLVETFRRMDVGIVAALRVRFGNEEYRDDVQVVRCQAIAGAGSLYHVGMRFLSTSPRNARSIRHAVARHVGGKEESGSSRSIAG
jgi:hypothetical protein